MVQRAMIEEEKGVDHAAKTNETNPKAVSEETTDMGANWNIEDF